MHTLFQFVIRCVVIVSVASAALAQDKREADAARATITAVASTERVRFTAPSSVVQMHLEVYSETALKLFDFELKGGNVLDWHWQNGQAERLGAGAYLCVVTVKNLSGKITQKIGTVTVAEQQVTVGTVQAAELTAQQEQAIGPLEAEASLTVLKEDDNETPTIIAHNGEDGLIARGRGALSFRIGDFFSGKDVEQMRLTAEGYLGIGITHPQVRLDVDGLIRASQGIMFPDGTIQTTAAITSGTRRGRGDQSQTGQGAVPVKQDRTGRTGKGHGKVSPEFTSNEDLIVNGNIIFTPGLSRDITVQDNNGGIRIFANSTLTGSPATAAIQFFGNGHAGFPGQAFIDSGANDNAAVIFRTAGTGGTIAERMRITANGNVGIGTGTTAPTSKLEIAAQDGLKISGFQPFLTLNDTNTNLRSILAGGNGDFGFYPHSFIGGSPAVIIKNSSGNVGIGTTSPTLGKLQVDGGSGLGVYGTSSGALIGGVEGDNSAASGIGVIGKANAASSVGVYGRSDNGVGVNGISANGFAIRADGNAYQQRDKGGWAKAMLYVDADGNIEGCYNSQTGASLTGGTTHDGCGFHVDQQSTGFYMITSPFQVNDRFAIVSPEPANIFTPSGGQHTGANIEYFGGSSISKIMFVTTFYSDTRGASDNTTTAFTLIIY